MHPLRQVHQRLPDAPPADLHETYDGKQEDLDNAVDCGMMDCIECGSCAYVCPARIPLVAQFRLTKGKIQAKRMAERAKAEAEKKKAEAEAAARQRTSKEEKRKWLMILAK